MKENSPFAAIGAIALLAVGIVIGLTVREAWAESRAKNAATRLERLTTEAQALKGSLSARDTRVHNFCRDYGASSK